MNFSQYSSLKVLVKIIINELNMMSSMVFRKPICNSVRNDVKFYKKKKNWFDTVRCLIFFESSINTFLIKN